MQILDISAYDAGSDHTLYLLIHARPPTPGIYDSLEGAVPTEMDPMRRSMEGEDYMLPQGKLSCLGTILKSTPGSVRDNRQEFVSASGASEHLLLQEPSSQAVISQFSEGLVELAFRDTSPPAELHKVAVSEPRAATKTGAADLDVCPVYRDKGSVRSRVSNRTVVFRLVEEQRSREVHILREDGPRGTDTSCAPHFKSFKPKVFFGTPFGGVPTFHRRGRRLPSQSKPVFDILPFNTRVRDSSRGLMGYQELVGSRAYDNAQQR